MGVGEAGNPILDVIGGAGLRLPRELGTTEGSLVLP